MPVFIEGDLQFTVADALDARKLDDASHGLSHCMKAVDFVVELPHRYLFIEFKDPEHPSSRPESRQDFIRDFYSNRSNLELAQKFRDSFIYEWASGRAFKPIRYYVLVAIAGLTEANLQASSEDLRRKLPAGIPSVWRRSIVEYCAVFNIDSWNRFLPRFQVRRLSDS